MDKKWINNKGGRGHGFKKDKPFNKNKQNNITDIVVKSVYNFVPAPEESEVFYPDWASQVSHDIPFSDGESGEIEVDIVAETPIFIRNGHSKADKEEYEKWKADGMKNINTLPSDTQEILNRYLSFSNYKGTYFIPGSSIKGMLRSVVEIISFGKLNPNLVDDNRFSHRDLTKASLYMEKYRNFIKDIKAGWLVKTVEGEWVIEECESLKFISHTEIDKINNKVEFVNTFGKKLDDKSASFKYNLWKVSLKSTFKDSIIDKNRQTVVGNTNGVEGTFVFTGQSSPRNEVTGKGKKYEFVFFDKIDPKIIKVDAQMKKDFLFIYNDGNKNVSIDWKMWKLKLENNEKVPVFFAADRNDNLLHFGLAYMYKLPYENSIHQMMPIKSYGKKQDLADCIFGTIDKEGALKGRVFISNAVSKDAKIMGMKSELLSSPKPSFIPFYLDQNNRNEDAYRTYEDNDSFLSGFKKYPVHSSKKFFDKEKIGVYSEEQLESKSVFSHFIPLDKGTIFKLKIRFHNLKKIEVGALVSALTMHDSPYKYHSLGGIKPYGYGKVKLSITGFKSTKNKFNSDLNLGNKEYLINFEKFMDEFCLEKKFKFNWRSSRQITELFALSSSPSQNVINTLMYPILDHKRNINHFKDIKKTNKYLLHYSKLNKDEKS